MDFWYSLLVFSHVLLFVYWLGGDLGVFYGSFSRNNPKHDLKTRAIIAKVCADIDMAPRTTLVLIAPIGFSLAAYHGWAPVTGPWLVALWIFSAGWLFLVWWQHLAHASPKKAFWTRIDLYIRWVAMVSLVLSALYSLFVAPIYGQNWLALKVLIYGGCIACGIGIRLAGKPGFMMFQEILREGSTPEREKAMNDGARNARRFVKGIWVLVALAAFIGIWKPDFTL